MRARKSLASKTVSIIRKKFDLKYLFMMILPKVIIRARLLARPEVGQLLPLLIFASSLSLSSRKFYDKEYWEAKKAMLGFFNPNKLANLLSL